MHLLGTRQVKPIVPELKGVHLSISILSSNEGLNDLLHHITHFLKTNGWEHETDEFPSSESPFEGDLQGEPWTKKKLRNPG